MRVGFLALLLYVVLDFANPLMPGAVCFDPDDSVDGVARARSSSVAPPALADPAVPLARLVAPAPRVALPDPPTVTTSGRAEAPPHPRGSLPSRSERSPEDA